jgi:predicted Zn-dependent protease
VHVIDAPKVVNAFATPGGHVYVYSGLLLAADNEAEMAGVLAHESGHVAGRHVERAMVNAYGMQGLTAVALGQNPSAATQMAAGLVGTGVLRAHSRSEEIEGDEYGARYISSLNYDPESMIAFYEKLEAAESAASAGPDWLRTHPVTAERISNLRAYTTANHLGGRVLGAERHRAIQAKLVGIARSTSGRAPAR